MREVVLDTETTGLDPKDDRIVDIGCVELFNHLPTQKTFQRYINPERDVPEGALAIHKLDNEFLSKQPVFADVVDAFLEFIGDSPLIMHNADFDMGFVNAELGRLQRPPLAAGRAIDTVLLARRRFPGKRAKLDDLCQRFGIDISHREIHGALKDAELTARVYLELIGERQPGLELAAANRRAATAGPRAPRAARPHAGTPEEEAAHAAFLKKLKKPIWRS